MMGLVTLRVIMRSCSRGREFVLGYAQCILWIEPCEKIDSSRNDACPSGLMACAETRTVVTMEILVEENVVLPVRIFLKLLRSAVHRALPACIAQKDARESSG